MKRTDSDSHPEYLGHYKVIAPLIMAEGVGDGKTTSCVMAQAATIWALSQGKTLDKPTDELHCACPLLRRMAIRANDTKWWKDNLERTEHLRPLIPLLLNSRQSEGVTWERIFHVVNNVVRVLTPQRLEFQAKKTKNEKLKASNIEGAAKLRGLGKIHDRESCMAAREVCLKLYRDADAYAAADEKIRLRTQYLALFREAAAITS